jgi:hypothetical protein
LYDKNNEKFKLIIKNLKNVEPRKVRDKEKIKASEDLLRVIASQGHMVNF